MFSKACEYGIRATIYIAQRSIEGERPSLKEITKAINSPTAFTGKILQLLAKNNIISSIKGPKGGYEIDKSQLDIVNLLQIVNAIDGGHVYKRCGMGLQDCSEKHPCPIHFKFKEIREDLKKMLKETTLAVMISQNEIDYTFLK